MSREVLLLKRVGLKAPGKEELITKLEAVLENMEAAERVYES